MIKKILAVSGITLVVNSFAFWPLNKVYFITSITNDLDHQQKIGKPWGETGLVGSETIQNIQALFLYDKHTFNWIVEKIRPEQLNINNILKFLNCDFEYSSNFWEGGDLRSLVKEGEMNKIFGYKKEKLLKKDQCFENLTFDDPDWSFAVSQELKSLSGVVIKNMENGVMLSKNSKNVELTPVLVNYFSRLALNKKVLDRLNQSTILTVWCLIPKRVGRGKIESEIMGLAKDNYTGKLFHWTTDLYNDVSILMQYDEY